MSIQDKNFEKKFQEVSSQYRTPANYITDYLKKNPQQTEKIRALHQQGTDDITIAKGIMYKESSPTLLQEYKGGVKADLYSSLASANYVRELIANQLGTTSPSALKAAEKYYRKAQESTGAVPDVFEAKNAGEVAHGLTHMAGGLTGFIASIAAGGGIGGGVAKLGETVVKKKIASALTKRLLDKYGKELGTKELGEEAAKKYLARKAVRESIAKAGGIGEKVGAFTTAAIPQIGGQYGAGNFEHPLKAIAGGAATGALYTLSPFRMLGALKGGQVSLASKISGDLLKSVEKSKFATKYPGTTSGAIEGLKQSIEQAAILSSAAATTRFGSNLDLVSPEALKEYKQSGIMGAGLGLVGGGMAGRFGKAGKQLAVKAKLTKMKEAFKEEKKEPKEAGLPAIPYKSSLLKSLEKTPLNKELTGVLGLNKEAKEKLWKQYKGAEPTFRIPKEYAKLIETPVATKEAKKAIPKYKEFLHRRVIETAFETGQYDTLMKSKPEDTIKVLESAGISNKEITSKYLGRTPQKQWTKDMVESYVFAKTKETTTPITYDSIPTLMDRMNTISGVKNPAIVKVLAETRGKIKDFLKKELKEMKLGKVFPKTVRELNLVFSEKSIGKKKLGGVLKSINELRFLHGAAEGLIKGADKIKEYKAKTASLLLQNIKVAGEIAAVEGKFQKKQKLLSKYPALKTLEAVINTHGASTILLKTGKIDYNKVISSLKGKKVPQKAIREYLKLKEDEVAPLRITGTVERIKVAPKKKPPIKGKKEIKVTKKAKPTIKSKKKVEPSAKLTRANLKKEVDSYIKEIETKRPTAKELQEKVDELYDKYSKGVSRGIASTFKTNELNTLIQKVKAKQHEEANAQLDNIREDKIRKSEAKIKETLPERIKHAQDLRTRMLLDKKYEGKEIEVDLEAPNGVRVIELSAKKKKLKEQATLPLEEREVFTPKEMKRLDEVMKRGEEILTKEKEVVEEKKTVRKEITEKVYRIKRLREEAKTKKDVKKLAEIKKNIAEIKKNIAILLEVAGEDTKANKEMISRLSYKGKRTLEDYNRIGDEAFKELSKSFGVHATSLLERMYGKEIAQKVKVKFTKEFTLEDLGGRESLIRTVKRDYGEEISHLSDKEILAKLKTIEGYTKIDPFDKSILINIAYHQTDNVAATLYHEIFHIAERYNLIPKEHVEALKKYLDKEMPADGREWYEKAADDFSWYLASKTYKPANNIVSGIYMKIKQFINRLRLKFSKIKSKEDVYARIFEGEYSPENFGADQLAYIHRKLADTVPIVRYSKKATTVEEKFSRYIKANNGRNVDSYKTYARDIISKVRTNIKSFWDNFTKGLSPELHTGETAMYEYIVRRTASHKGVAIHDTNNIMREIQEGLSKQDLELMTKHLIAQDLFINLREGIQSMDRIKRQWEGVFDTPEDITRIAKGLKEKAAKNEVVTAALKKRAKFYEEIFDYLAEEGLVDKEMLNPEAYFHRINAEYFNESVRMHTPFMGKPPRVDPLIERVNSYSPYITDYIYSDYEAFAQFNMLKLYAREMKEIAKLGEPTLAELKKDYIKLNPDKDPSKITKKQLLNIMQIPHLKEKYKKWTVLKVHEIPHYYTIYTFPQDLVEALLDDSLTSKQKIDLIDSAEFKGKEKIGIQKFDKTVLVRRELLPALRRITQTTTPPPIVRMMQWNISLFKKMVLFFPTKVTKYFFNNATGDTDISMALSPKIVFKEAPQATKDLFAYYYKGGKGLSPQTIAEIEKAIHELVIGTNITAQEVEGIESVDSLNMFKDILGTKPFPLRIASGYWKDITKVNNFREDILRLAAWRYYKKELATKSVEQVYSVVPIEIARNIPDMELLAAKMAREGIGDYGNISPNGQWLRKNIIPFWSWTEINLPRYVRLFRAVIKQRNVMGGLPFVVSSAFKMAFFFTAVNMWNSTFFPEESALINEANNGQLHLILGRRPNGEYITLRFQGALSDALDWFGLGNIKQITSELAEGKIGFGDVLKGIPISTVNKGINSSMPIVKNVVENLAGLSLFPDVTNPRPIRDKMGHFMQLYGLSLPYKMVFSNTPLKETERSLTGKMENTVLNSLTFSTDIEETNYFISKNLVNRFLENNNIKPPRITPTDKSNYAYFYKKSLKYGDKDKAVMYLAKYYELGGTLKTMKKSLLLSNPIYGIPRNKRYFFLKSLTPEDRAIILRAIEWYEDIYLHHFKFSAVEMQGIYREAYRMSRGKLLERRKVKTAYK